MTGLSVDTLRAWERRYKVVAPERSSRGRLYGETDVRRFLRLRAAVGNGYSIGEAAAFTEAELDALSSSPAAPNTASSAGSVSEDRIHSVLNAITAFDAAKVNEELGRLAALLPPAEFVRQVALPLVREAGVRWHNGSMLAAHEHLATESVSNVLSALSRLNRPGDAQPKILATTPSGEFHELGVLAAAMLAGARGFSVTSLGPNLPAADILFASKHACPHALLLGLTTPEPLPPALDCVRAVSAALPSETELWLAGPGARAFAAETHPGLMILEDFDALEHHLNRLQSATARDSI